MADSGGQLMTFYDLPLPWPRPDTDPKGTLRVVLARSCYGAGGD